MATRRTKPRHHRQRGRYSRRGRPAASGRYRLFHALAVLRQERTQELARAREIQDVDDRPTDPALDLAPPAAEVARAGALQGAQALRSPEVLVEKLSDPRGRLNSGEQA